MKVLGKHSISSVLQVIIMVAWYIQLLFLILLTVLLIVKFSTADIIESDLEVRLTQSKVVAVTPAPETTISKPTLNLDSGKLHFTQNQSWELVSYNLGVMWIGFAITLSITYLLRKIFDSLAQNKPFLMENTRRLRQIALLIILLSPFNLAKEVFTNWYVKHNFILEGSGIRTHVVIDLQTIFIGLVILIIAEIFRIGTQLKEEQDLTV